MQLNEPLALFELDAPQSKTRTQEWIKGAVLIGLSLYFAVVILSGNLTNYINYRFAWLSYLAVIIFGALAAATFYGALRNHGPARDYTHETITWPIILLVAFPLVLGTVVPSQPLGAAAVDGNIVTRVATVNTAASITKDPLQRNVLDWLRVFNDSTNPAEFNGQQADVVGFVYREPGFAEDQFMVARFTVACCVADASAIGLPVIWAGAGEIADGEWVQVRGTFEAGTFRETFLPMLRANTLEVVEQPKHPYLYP